MWKKGPALVPSWTAFAVIGLLESYFSRLVDYGFTASVENDLDDIAAGERSRVEWLRNFYFGSDGAPTDSQRISAQGGLKRLIASRLEEIDARGVNSIPIDGADAVVRVGRYGPYVQRGEGEDSQRASLPEDLAPDELTPEKVEELLSAPSGDRARGADADRPRDHRPDRPVRALRHRWREVGVAVQDDGPRHDHSRGRAAAADPAAHARRDRRRGGHRPERPLRPLHQEGHRLALARDRGPALHGQPGRGRGAARPAEAARSPGGGGAAAEGTRQRPGLGQADPGQGRPVRSLRHRRRDQCDAASWRFDRGDDRRAGVRAARRTPRPRARP